MSLDRASRLDYIEETAFALSDRLRRDADNEWDADLNRLREDVAWLSRSVAWLARLKQEDDAARDERTADRAEAR